MSESVIQILALISFVVGVVSIVLAFVAIKSANAASKEVRDNFDRTKQVLAEIDKRSAIIEKTVTESQRELMTTMTRIINETVIPKKSDPGEILGMKFIEGLVGMMQNDPKKAQEQINTLVSMKQTMDKL